MLRGWLRTKDSNASCIAWILLLFSLLISFLDSLLLFFAHLDFSLVVSKPSRWKWLSPICWLSEWLNWAAPHPTSSAHSWRQFSINWALQCMLHIIHLVQSLFLVIIFITLTFSLHIGSCIFVTFNLQIECFYDIERFEFSTALWFIRLSRLSPPAAIKWHIRTITPSFFLRITIDEFVVIGRSTCPGRCGPRRSLTSGS